MYSYLGLSGSATHESRKSERVAAELDGCLESSSSLQSAVEAMLVDNLGIPPEIVPAVSLPPDRQFAPSATLAVESGGSFGAHTHLSCILSNFSSSHEPAAGKDFRDIFRIDETMVSLIQR